MGEALLTTLSMENHHPSTLLSMDSSANSHDELYREMNRQQMMNKRAQCALIISGGSMKIYGRGRKQGLAAVIEVRNHDFRRRNKIDNLNSSNFQGDAEGFKHRGYSRNDLVFAIEARTSVKTRHPILRPIKLVGRAAAEEQKEQIGVIAGGSCDQYHCLDVFRRSLLWRGPGPEPLHCSPLEIGRNGGCTGRGWRTRQRLIHCITEFEAWVEF
ncbi:hypothetical protein NE237_015215 [Protea cynaroides]|uniref:Uncharacterized protein n=1 Tax=Protea cynaroides TaxID=273540 RepID=A0A9Q0KDR4_9MAGN|nr:hypothetical protein NE237_015215 [Protea cynaroides]